MKDEKTKGVFKRNVFGLALLASSMVRFFSACVLFKPGTVQVIHEVWRSHTLKCSWNGRTLPGINLSPGGWGYELVGLTPLCCPPTHLILSFHHSPKEYTSCVHRVSWFTKYFYPLSNLALNNSLRNLKLSMSSFDQRKTWKTVDLWLRFALPLDRYYRLEWAMPTDSQGALQLCQWLTLDPWVNGVETLCLRSLICEMGTSMVASQRDRQARSLSESAHLRTTSVTQCCHTSIIIIGKTKPGTWAFRDPVQWWMMFLLPYTSVRCNMQMPISASAFQGRAVPPTGFLLHRSSIKVSGLHSSTDANLQVFRWQARHSLPTRLSAEHRLSQVSDPHPPESCYSLLHFHANCCLLSPDLFPWHVSTAVIQSCRPLNFWGIFVVFGVCLLFPCPTCVLPDNIDYVGCRGTTFHCT